MNITLSDSLTKIPGISSALSEKFSAIGVDKIEDLLYFLPRAWDDLTQLSTTTDLIDPNRKYTVKVTLHQITAFRTSVKRMMMTTATARDDSGMVKVMWFNQPYLKSSLQEGATYYLSGRISLGRQGLILSNPEIEAASQTPVHSGRIVPTYSSVGGFTTKVLRRIFARLIPLLEPIPEVLPAEILKNHNLPNLDFAIRQLHAPSNMENLEAAKQRLAFDELVITQLRVQSMKEYLKSVRTDPIGIDQNFLQEIKTHLPFTLTDGQEEALTEILDDLSKEIPMSRLLEGDVGSGKTIVAAIAMMITAKSGFESALMAPTEVLAQQHYANLKPLFSQMGVSLALRTQTYKEGGLNAQVTIGTHALLQESVTFKNLNLVIVDEQHRFGVRQRETLKQKGTMPHFLSLTATPIPRSLALTLFGDLDLSIIHARPLDRKSIITKVITSKNRTSSIKRINEEISLGHQVFVVTPIISPSDKILVKSVETERLSLQKLFPTAKIGLLHGRLSNQDKNIVMQQFKHGELDILVATTVVEVGIDIPNATVMLIEGAERFGLAQLHQLRGRVGRSHHQSYAFVVPSVEEPDILERLELFSTNTDGFKLAEIDLQLRGPGSLLGSRQAGFVKYRLADWNDPIRIQQAQLAAKEIISGDPQLSSYPELRKRLNMEQVSFHAA